MLLLFIAFFCFGCTKQKDEYEIPSPYILNGAEVQITTVAEEAFNHLKDLKTIIYPASIITE